MPRAFEHCRGKAGCKLSCKSKNTLFAAALLQFGRILDVRAAMPVQAPRVFLQHAEGKVAQRVGRNHRCNSDADLGQFVLDSKALPASRSWQADAESKRVGAPTAPLPPSYSPSSSVSAPQTAAATLRQSTVFARLALCVSGFFAIGFWHDDFRSLSLYLCFVSVTQRILKG
mmetsp:Transcript_8957/g.21060  ORF Transcript_8957/g.21060 Transcript_8957/m.21060 type:complete len:172 (-) Transcript_8957:71-586(-)